VPVTAADVVTATGLVVIAKLADALPTGIVTLVGTDTDEAVVESLTTIVPLDAPATALSVTVPTELVPPMTVAGAMLIERIWNGLTVSVAVCWTPP